MKANSKEPEISLKDLKKEQIYPESIIKSYKMEPKKASNSFRVNKYTSIFVEVVTDSNMNKKACEHIPGLLNRCKDMKSVSYLFINCKPQSAVSPNSSQIEPSKILDKTHRLEYIVIFVDKKPLYYLDRANNTLVFPNKIEACKRIILEKVIRDNIKF